MKTNKLPISPKKNIDQLIKRLPATEKEIQEWGAK